MSWNGRTMVSLIKVDMEILACLISLRLRSLSFPVNLRNRTAFLNRMVSPSVSGRKKVRKNKDRPEIHMSSQRGQRHPFASAAKKPYVMVISLCADLD